MQQARKAELQSARDAASSALAEARAELSRWRERAALLRDREARARQAGLSMACRWRSIRCAPRRVLNARSPQCWGAMPRLHWDRLRKMATGGSGPGLRRLLVLGSLAAHVTQCPPQLAARLALVHVAETMAARWLRANGW